MAIANKARQTTGVRFDRFDAVYRFTRQPGFGICDLLPVRSAVDQNLAGQALAKTDRQSSGRGFRLAKARHPPRISARARLELDDDQKLVANIYPNQDSGVLSSAVWADGLVEIAEGQTLKAGDMVDYLSFEQLLA